PTPAYRCCATPLRRSGSQSASCCAGRSADQPCHARARPAHPAKYRVDATRWIARVKPGNDDFGGSIMAEKRWIPETLFDDLGFRMTYAAERVLHETRTEHQHLVLFEHKRFGKVLMLDGASQVTTADEFIYHEMMTHVPILAHGRAREVLVVGGGDCGIAEELLKHKSVARLTQVEIDASVVEFAKEHFPEFTGPVLADRRFDLVIGDGMNYVATTDRRFDVIIV